MAKKNLRNRDELTTNEKYTVLGYSRLIEKSLGIEHSNNYSVRGLCDHTQTHALYGITNNEEQYWRDELKNAGAVSLRKVKAGSDLIVLCFSAHKMFDDFIMVDSY